MSQKPYTIVLGNEKGGTGKSTAAMHVITYLLRQNFRVASLDIDARQGTLTRYVENRKARLKNTQEDLPVSEHKEWILQQNSTSQKNLNVLIDRQG